jgi:hypothetical protein
MTLKQRRSHRRLSAQLSKIENGKSPLDLAQLARLPPRWRADRALFRLDARLLVTPCRRPGARRPTARELVGPEPGPRRHHNLVRPVSDMRLSAST